MAAQQHRGLGSPVNRQPDMLALPPGACLDAQTQGDTFAALVAVSWPHDGPPCRSEH